MGVLTSGILGPVSGKVSGVVGARWKDRAYIRQYAKPANPNTALQQVQRTKFADCVAFAKPLVGPVFNAYTDYVEKSMSGFNRFVKSNIAVFDGSPDYSALKVTEGKLHFDSAASGATSGSDIDFMFGTGLGNNGLATDKVYAIAYNTVTGIFYFPTAEVARSAEVITFTGLAAQKLNIIGWLWAARYSGSQVSMVSASVHIAGGIV
jgi:hypothetical protein